MPKDVSAPAHYEMPAEMTLSCPGQHKEILQGMSVGDEIEVTVTGTLTHISMDESGTRMTLTPTKVGMQNEEGMTIEKALDNNAKKRRGYT